MSKKQKNYFCKSCGKEIEGNPKYALIRDDFPVFCTHECQEKFIKLEKEQKK